MEAKSYTEVCRSTKTENWMTKVNHNSVDRLIKCLFPETKHVTLAFSKHGFTIL